MGETLASFGRMCAIASCAFVLTLTAETQAWAQPEDVGQAVQLRKEGIRFATQGLWHEAHRRLERSARLQPHPETLFHLAKVHAALGQRVEALATYRRLLEFTADPVAQPYVLAARSKIPELEAQVSVLRIVVNPDDALGQVVSLDGRRLTDEQLSAGLTIEPGPHQIRVRALDHDATTQDVEVVPGQTTVVTVTLHPVAKAVRPRAPVLPPTPETSRRPLDEWIAYGAIGGGSAALAAGGTIGLIAIAQAANAERHETAEADAARDKAVAADFFGAIGVVSLGVGIVMLLNAGSATSPTTGTRDGFVLRF